MDKVPSKKAKIFCCILILTASAVFVLLGLREMSVYTELINKCTSEVTGTVVYEGKDWRAHNGSVSFSYGPEYKYVNGKRYRQIEVKTDGVFNFENIYCRPGVEKKGDNITIHYDPDDPENYYISDWASDHKATGIVAFAGAGILILITILIMAKSKRYYKQKEQSQRKYIYFYTPYCKFLFSEFERGYEGETVWEYNLSGEKSCTVFFETDTLVNPPDESYLGLVEKNFPEDREPDLDINNLIHKMPQLRDLRPGECYKRLEKILFNKKERDYEIRKMIADHFIFKPGLIRENVTEQELMDSIELSHIGAYRNGDIEVSIHISNIYVDNLRMVFKEDGSKEIHYKTDEQTGSDDECCDVL